MPITHTPTEEAVFSRRRLLFGIAQFGVFGLLVGRLYYLQIMRSDLYATLAEDNRVDVQPLAPPRGRILDRIGRPLADNDRNLQVELIPEQVPDMAETLKQLAAILDLSSGQQRKIMRAISRGPAFRAVPIAENLDWARFARVNLQLPFLPGVQPLVGERRAYRYGAVTAHTVGYVGAKTKRDLERMGDTPSAYVGRNGLERVFESDLRGAAGVRRVEVNAYGRTVRELMRENGTPGRDLHVTLDVDLQVYAAKRLAKYSGSAVVMDVKSGEVLALVSSPAFDPNVLSRGADIDSWERMRDDDFKPLLNKAIGGLYAPGSTFKMIVALAALQAGVVKPDEEMFCGGDYTLGKEKFHCWLPEGHGSVAMADAIARSCDVYFYEIARRTGIDNIEKMARRFGFGRQTGIELPAEKSGVVPGRDWKRSNLDAGWRSGETIITGIGQGYLLTTPLQMAAMTATLANGGRRITPTLVKPPETAPTVAFLNTFEARHIDLVKRGMYRAVNRPEGTAYASSLLVGGARLCGKTATVQVRRISLAEREAGITPNHELERHLRDHSLFVGYAPHDTPRYAISVAIEHGGSGSAVAAPIARDIMVKLLRRKPEAA